MRVLVTGATGFVGSHVAEAFAARGAHVVASVRQRSSLRWLDGVPVETRELDLATPRNLEALCQGIDLVVHAGGITRAAAATDYQQINAEGTRALLQAAAAAGVRRCVLVSSLAARGPDGAPGPTSPYGQSKLEAERIAAGYLRSLDVVALRVAGVYGPRDTDLLPLFRLARRGALLLPPASGRLQPVFAADVAELIASLAHVPIEFGPWPVAESRAYGWSELATLLGNAVGRRVRVLHAPRALFLTAAVASESVAALLGAAPTLDRRRALDITDSYTCDVTKTETASGWQARTALKDGLERTVRWYREHRWL